MKKEVTEYAPWNYTHLHISGDNTVKFESIINFGPAGIPAGYYPVDAVPREIKTVVDAYYASEVPDRYDIAVYNSWLQKYYGAPGRPIMLEIIEHRLRIDRTIYTCGHSEDAESWDCSSPYAKWGYGVTPERPYRHDYPRDNPVLIATTSSDICHACQAQARLLITPWPPVLLVFEWGNAAWYGSAVEFDDFMTRDDAPDFEPDTDEFDLVKILSPEYAIYKQAGVLQVFRRTDVGAYAEVDTYPAPLDK